MVNTKRKCTLKKASKQTDEQNNKVYLGSTHGTFKNAFTIVKSSLYIPNTFIVPHVLIMSGTLKTNMAKTLS